MNKNKTTFFLLAFFMFFIFSPVNYTAAAPIDDIVNQMQDIYGYMSDTDKSNISDARTALQDFAANGSETQWETVLGLNTPNNLLTSEVITRFGGEALARAAAKDIFTGLGEIYYSTDSTELRATIEDFKAEYIDEFQILFGSDITMEELYGLFFDALEALPDVISETEAGLLANDSKEDLIDAMPIYLERAMDAALLLPANQTFSGRLADIGWSTQKLIAQQNELTAIIDQDGSAQLSLALAIIRSETTLASGPTTLQVGDKPQYTVNIMGSNASSLVAWASADPTIVKVSNDITTGKFVIEAVAPGTTELIVYRDYFGADLNYDWLLKFDVTVGSLSSGGGGGGGGALPGYALRTVGSTLEEYDAIFDIPKNAVKYDTRGDIERFSSDKIDAPDNSFIPGNIFELTKIAAGDFLKPITVTLPYKQSAVDLEKYNLSIYWFDENSDEWVELDDVKVNEDDLTVSGKTIKTGYFAIIATNKTAVPPVKPPVDPAVPVLNDISGHWAKANIEYLVEKGAIAGYPDNTFRPDNSITRAEFAVVIVKAFDLKAASGKVFEDTANHWAKDYIATAAANGIVTGYSDREFSPDELITREQMAVIIVKAAKLTALTGELTFSDKADVSEWASSWVITATQNNLMSGYPDNTFKPQGNATRAEAVTVICNVLKK